MENKDNKEIKKFKILVVGDAEVGKTTFITRVHIGEFEKEYVPTEWVEIHKLRFNTEQGIIKFKMYDCSFNRLSEYSTLKYYTKADGIIIMASCIDSRSISNLQYWTDKISEIRKDIPIAYAINKCDIKHGKVEDIGNAKNLGNGQNLMLLSSKSNYNIEKPFLYLARELLKDETLKFIELPAIKPPVIEL